jgi:excinuclease ABC subunit A
MDLIKAADWIIDLGPEGGAEGGYILAEGTPEEISKNEESFTGQYLKMEFEREKKAVTQ